MEEYTLDDGRKAEKVENAIDPFTKVIEVYVEPKATKKLSQRIIEKLCVCERRIETIDESTGEVLESVVQNLCDGEVKVNSKELNKSTIQLLIEEKIKSNVSIEMYVLIAAIVIQFAAVVYVFVL